MKPMKVYIKMENQLMCINSTTNAILDGGTTVVLKWIGWMDGLSKHVKVHLLTSDFCIVLPGLFSSVLDNRHLSDI